MTSKRCKEIKYLGGFGGGVLDLTEGPQTGNAVESAQSTKER